MNSTRLPLLFLFILLNSSSVYSQEWGENQGINDLVVSESIISIYQVHISGERVFVAATKADANNVLFYSDDNGASWEQAEFTSTFGNFSVIANSGTGDIYSYGYDLFGGKYVRKSADNGASWSELTPNSANFPFVFIPIRLAAIDSILITSSTAIDVGFLKSTNAGLDWETFTNFPDDGGNKAVVDLFSSGDYFYLVSSSNGKGLFRSHKDSTNWEEVRIPEEETESVLGATITRDGKIMQLYSGGLEYSEDDGETWMTKTYEELGFSGELPTTYAQMGSNTVVGLSSSENGPSVELLANDLSESNLISEGIAEYTSDTRINLLRANSSAIFAVRANQATKLWVYSDGEGGEEVSIENDGAPEVFRLNQNYPNPFNPSTSISFTIPATGITSLKVYSLLGQEVETLVNEMLVAGSYTINLDASGLTSGVYIYRLTTGANTITRKMTLIK